MGPTGLGRVPGMGPTGLGRVPGMGPTGGCQQSLDWTTGLDYWTDQFYHKIHTSFENPCILIFVLELSLNRVLEVPPAPDTGCMMII